MAMRYKISPGSKFRCWRELCRLLIGDALQDRFAVFARELVDRGKRGALELNAKGGRFYQHTL